MQLGPDHLFLLHLAAALEAFQPLGMLARLHLFGEEGEHLARIALDAHRDGDDFPDFGRVDVDMDDVGLRGVGVHGAGDPVVETHAHGDEQVALVGHDVGSHVSVHPDHALIQREVRA